MTVAEYKRKQKEKLALQKNKPLQKISNNFINNTIASSNANAVKTIYYLASIIEKFDQLEEQADKLLLDVTIDTREMLKYTGITLPEIRRNLKAMQETSITFIDEKEGIEEGINLLPLYKFVYGKHQIKISLFTQIAKMIVDVKKNYTFINTKELMKLKSKHSLRLLPLLNTIAGYDKGIDKSKNMTLEELNEFFGTKHRSLYDLENKILIPIKEELDINSKLSFVYEINFESLGRGRPRAKNVTIEIIEKDTKNELALFNTEATKLPKKVEEIQGTYGFKSEPSFYQPFTDGSFNLEKEDGSKQFFKSIKQLEFFMKNPDKFSYKG